MSKSPFFSVLALSSLYLMNLQGDSPSEEICGTAPKPMRITTRHIEGNGIGYNRGYTTIEGFLAPYQYDRWIPFVDLRGHVLNDGQLAANAGVGVRYKSDARIWGINSYYDYRNSRHYHYNQVALGFESLGKIWDFRLNGYLPVGAKTSHAYGWQNDTLQGHQWILKAKREFAMQGSSGEVGFHLDHFPKVPLYFAAGPYYLQGKGDPAWGGQLRAALELSETLRIEGNTSYDNRFQWVGQGQISLIIPIGHKKQIKKTNKPCSRVIALEKRAVQKVDRFEIIPVDTQKRTAVAIDSATGKPYYFSNVAAGGHSNGTVQNPFGQLGEGLAQVSGRPGAIVYVSGGEPFDAQKENLDGYTLPPGTSLLGAGISHSLPTQFGSILLPSGGSTPQLTNSQSSTEQDLSAVLHMEDYTTVSGVSIIGCPVIGIQSAGYNAGRQVEGVQINNVSITSELYPPEEDNVITDNDIYWNNYNYAGIRLNAKDSQIRGANVRLHLLNHGATGIAVTGSGSVTRSSVRVSSVAGDAIGMNAKGWAVLRNQVAVESQSGSAEGVGYVATTSSGQTILTLNGNYITIESGEDVYGLRVQTEVDSCTMDLINNQITISGVTGSAYGIDLDIRNSDCTANILNESNHTISVSTTGDAYGIRSEAFETGFSLDIQSIISATAGDGAAYGINSFNAEDCNINIYSDDYLTTCTAKSTNESAYGIYIAATTPAESSIIISGVKILPTGGVSAYGIHTSEADVDSLTIKNNVITVNTTISGDLCGITAAIAPVCNVTGNGVIVESSKGSAWGIYLTGDQISPLTLTDNTISLAFQNGQQIEENAYGIVIHDTNDDPNEYPSTTITNSTISIKMGGVEAIGIQITQGANSDITIASTKLQMICAGDTTGIQITPGTNSQITIDDIQKFGVNSTVLSAYGINVLDDAGGTISLFQVTPGVVNEGAYINGYNEVCGIKIDDSISVTKLVIDNADFAIETNFIGHSNAAPGYGIRVPVPTDSTSYIANTTISIGQTAGRSFNACYGMQLTCNQDESSIILQNNTLAAGYSRIGCYGIEFNNDAYADCSLSTSGATYFDIGRNNEWSKGNMYGLHVDNAGSNFTLNAAGLSILDGFSIKAYSGSTYFVGIDNTGVNASLNVTGANVVGAASGYATEPHWVYINADGSDQSINVSNCSFKYASSLPAKDYIPFTIVNGTSATITSCVIQNNRSDCGGKNTAACIPSSFTNNHLDYIAPLCWSNNGQLNYVLDSTEEWSVSSSCLSGN